MSEPKKRPRSEKDIVPEFTSGEDALEFMEKKLNGSWTDALDQSEKAQYEVVEVDTENLDNATVDDVFKKMMGL